MCLTLNGKADEKELVSLLSDLVRINSINPFDDASGAAGGEAALRLLGVHRRFRGGWLLRDHPGLVPCARREVVWPFSGGGAPTGACL